MRTSLTINRRGVITLPVKLRKALGLKPDDQLIAETTPDGLLLRPAITLPVEVYTPERVREFDEAESELAQLFIPVGDALTMPSRAATRRKRTP